MKILIAVHHFPPRYGGGAEWRAHRTATAIQSRNHQVRVICVERIDAGTADGVAWSDEIYDGIPVRRLSFNLAASPDQFRWKYDNPWIGQHLQALLQEDPPDVFHLISGYLLSGSSLRAAQQHGIPTVVSLTDYWFLCPRIIMLRSDGKISTLPINPVQCARCLGEEQRRYRWPGRIAPGLMKRYWSRQTECIQQVQTRLTFLQETLNKVNVIISPSQFLRKVFIDAGVQPERIIYSRQGHDFPYLNTNFLQKSPSPWLRIGYIGQIAWLKGVHVLFEAVSLLNQAPLEITAYGDTAAQPAYTQRLQRMARGDKRLELAGAYKRQEISQVLSNLDVIVVPSLWYENSPNVILEAFAHRTPVIASNQGGMAELVQHEKNGLLFEAGNPADLARQIQRLLDEPELRASLAAGIEPVKNLTQEIDDLEATYQRLCDRTPADLQAEAQ